MFLTIAGALLAGQIPSLPKCEVHALRTVRSASGLVATEDVKVCDAGGNITTAQDEVFVSWPSQHQETQQLVAVVDSIGLHGAPLEWVGNRLVIHVPSNALFGFLKHRARFATIRINRDYGDAWFMRDNAEVAH